jgi:hypothetical protein
MVSEGQTDTDLRAVRIRSGPVSTRTLIEQVPFGNI